MCYDSPKAAHFDAYRRGELLPATDPSGLLLRWHAARIVYARVTCNMLRMNASTKRKIADALDAVRGDSDIEVHLRETGSVSDD
jgi:hypothetical protein